MINNCLVRYDKDTGIPLGTFACTCGFTYLRKGPDQTPDDSYKLDQVIQYGQAWENELRHLWADEITSKEAISERLGMAIPQLNLYAARLGLPTKDRSVDIRVRNRLQSNDIANVALKEKCQAAWLELRHKYPHAGRAKLIKLAGWIYRWLREHEEDWLNEHTPPKQQTQNSRVDYELRDRVAAQTVLEAAARIHQESEYPKQITLTRLIFETDLSDRLPQQLDKLPLTKQALEQVLDTPITYNIRRIEWFTREYAGKGQPFSRSKVVAKLQISKIQEDPQIKVALDKAMELLNQGDLTRTLDSTRQ